MKRNNILLTIIAGVLSVFVVFFLIFKTIKPDSSDSSFKNKTSKYGFVEIPEITSEPNPDIQPVNDGRFVPASIKDKEYLTVYKELSLHDYKEGAWGQISDDEWMVYGTIEDYKFYSMATMIKDITKAPTFNPFIEVEQDGYIGIDIGGYQAGTFSNERKTYYIVDYYISGYMSCTYLTSDKEKVAQGQKLAYDNILAIVDDPSLMEDGTGFEDDSSVNMAETALHELYNDAQYSDLVPQKDYDKMRLLFTADRFECIKEVYVRCVGSGELFYPVEEEEHDPDECVFVIDNVKAGEPYQFVVFSDSDPGKIRAAAVEYEESATVKRRNQEAEVVPEEEPEDNEVYEDEENEDNTSGEDVVEIIESEEPDEE